MTFLYLSEVNLNSLGWPLYSIGFQRFLGEGPSSFPGLPPLPPPPPPPPPLLSWSR